jgi:hypothetical protein
MIRRKRCGRVAVDRQTDARRTERGQSRAGCPDDARCPCPHDTRGACRESAETTTGSAHMTQGFAESVKVGRETSAHGQNLLNPDQEAPNDARCPCSTRRPRSVRDSHNGTTRSCPHDTPQERVVFALSFGRSDQPGGTDGLVCFRLGVQISQPLPVPDSGI